MALSAVGIWLTDDGGRTWRNGNRGIVPRYLPEEARDEETLTLCVHNVHRSRARPERLFLQFHGGVYRSDDAGESWVDISDGLPSDFGFPLVVDPDDPDSAYVIPLTADMDRGHPRGPRPRLRDARRGHDLDCPRRRPARRERLPHRAAPGLRPRRLGAGNGPVLRCHVGRRLRLGRRRRNLVDRGVAPAPGALGQGRLTPTHRTPTGARSPSAISCRSRGSISRSRPQR